MSVNRVMLVGRLGAGPELRWLDDGDSMLRLRLAANTRFTCSRWGEEQMPRHAVQVRGRMSAVVQEQAGKGSESFVEGELRHRGYEEANQVSHRVRLVMAARRESVSSIPSQEGAERQVRPESACPSMVRGAKAEEQSPRAAGQVVVARNFMLPYFV